MSYLYIPLWDKRKPIHYLEYLEEEHKKSLPPSFCKNQFFKSFQHANALLRLKFTHFTLKPEIDRTLGSGKAIVEIDINTDPNLPLKETWEAIYLLGTNPQKGPDGQLISASSYSKKIENDLSPKKLRIKQKHAFLFSYYLANKNPAETCNNINKLNDDLNRVICSYL
jgi:hypothetical protein